MEPIAPLLITLPDGPVDIVGDVHGELDALLSLLEALGYDRDGNHAEGRSLIFVGDLCDRGPDSPGVIDLVRNLIQIGRATCVIGTHELNLLKGDRKHGNDWFWNSGTERDREFEPCRSLKSDDEREAVLRFFRTLPLAASRADLRVTHAAWDMASLKRIQQQSGIEGLAALFDFWDEAVLDELRAEGSLDPADAEREAHEHLFWDRDATMPMLERVGRRDERQQMGNPLRVLTSGAERLTQVPFFASGHWRFVERVRWWDDYDDATPVVIGHYWRAFDPHDRIMHGKGEFDPFNDIAPLAWMGKRRNVFCIDYSVGGRFIERNLKRPLGSTTRLGALRWPERTVVFETGEALQTQGFAEPDVTAR
ncbi:hypothetical protein BH10PSE17_BH10PSE17_18990 [soil metagenome]